MSWTNYSPTNELNYFPFLSPPFFFLLLLPSFFLSANNQIHTKCLYMTSSLPGARGPCWRTSPSGSHPGGETASEWRWFGSYSGIKALLALLRGTRNVKLFCSVSLRTTLQTKRSKLVLPQKQIALLPCLATSPWKTFSICSVFIHDIRTIPSVSFHVSFLSSQIKSNENLRIYEESLLLTLTGNPELPSAMTRMTTISVIQAGLFGGKKGVIISLAPAHHCLSYTWLRALIGIYYLWPPLIIVCIVYTNIRLKTPWHQGVDFWAAVQCHESASCWAMALKLSWALESSGGFKTSQYRAHTPNQWNQNLWG